MKLFIDTDYEISYWRKIKYMRLQFPLISHFFGAIYPEKSLFIQDIIYDDNEFVPKWIKAMNKH